MTTAPCVRLTAVVGRLVARRGVPPAVGLVCAVIGACGGGDTVEGPPPAAPDRIELSSPAFPPDGTIPVRFSCEGEDVSPPLQWSGVPDDARSLALLVEDPDASGFVHWTLYDVAPATTALREAELPRGGREGENSFGDEGYGGPCPPEGDAPHRYVFTLYALRSPLELEAGAGPQQVRDAIAGAALARGQLTGRFGR
jgi:Raf kinase inhibitor-like YbhB/YbcL family protein